MKSAKTVSSIQPVEAGCRTRSLKREGVPVLDYTVRWPRLPDDSRAMRRINRYYRALTGRWQARWEKILYPRACAETPDRPWSAVLDYQITCQRDNLLSVRMDAREDAGTSRPLLACHSCTWDLESGTPRPLRSFFPPHTRWRAQVLEELHRKAEKNVASGVFLYFEDWPRRLRVWFDPDHFYLTDEGIALFYPLYTLAPYLEGIPVLLLDRDFRE